MIHCLAPTVAAIVFGTAALAQQPPETFATAAASALAHYPSAGVAVVRIVDGEIGWTGYAGEQGPGTPVTRSTLFNTASLAKTVTAELMLRLADAGHLALDEPIATEYVHPDLAEDPRYRLLTPAIMLSHQAGLRNWPYSYDDSRLAFIQDPGTGFTYSGIGYQILSEFAARRMGANFPDLVRDWVLAPTGVAGDAFLGAALAPDMRRAKPMLRDGKYANIGASEMPPSAADNLFVTAPAYATLLLAMLEKTPLSGTLAGARVTPILDTADHAECVLPDRSECPIEVGQSLGWSVARFDEAHYVFHTGSDRGENAIAVYDIVGRDGWIAFVNGGNGMGVWLELMETLAPDDPYFHFVRSLPQVRQLLAQINGD